jgi:uncharacterized protein
MNKIDFIRQSVHANSTNINAVLRLFEEGSTVPFIARYRKEVTNSMDEIDIAAIQTLSKKYEDLILRKIFVLEKIEDQGKLSIELRKKIENCYDPLLIEDIYQPFKSKVKTKADKAKELGLEPLAKLIMSQSNVDIYLAAAKYVSKNVENEEVAISHAQNIIAEWVANDDKTRDFVRKELMRGDIECKVVSTKKEEAEKYQDYFDYSEKLSKCPSHRFLAVTRAQSESLCRVKIGVEQDSIVSAVNSHYIKKESPSTEIIEEAILDSYKRLLYPSLSSQVMTHYKEKADEIAIQTFSNNLRQLLLESPLGEKAILAIDPGFRTGCKVVCLDKEGDLMEDTTIFPTPPQSDFQKSQNTILHLLHKHNINVIAIGNGTASRETEAFINSIKPSECEVFIVSESGASIYSASEIAREEFPNKDVTVRGSISIGRRLMDPLAELIKIDPKSIGVGQYQYDVNQSELKNTLDNVVIECVNKVGVNINTASPYLLNYISGLGETLAKNIVEHRTKNGPFTDINQLKSVKRIGDKAFEQSAGFIRIKNGNNILDNTGVHPESYNIVYKMAKDSGCSVEEFVENKTVRSQIKLSNYVSNSVGLPTLKDIMAELDKPGLDIRGKAEAFKFSEDFKSIEELSAGMIVPGIVSNIANFGAFIDIGIKENALLHISQITKKFIKNPDEVINLHQKLNVKVTDVDVERKRISVTLLF